MICKYVLYISRRATNGTQSCNCCSHALTIAKHAYAAGRCGNTKEIYCTDSLSPGFHSETVLRPFFFLPLLHCIVLSLFFCVLCSTITCERDSISKDHLVILQDLRVRLIIYLCRAICSFFSKVRKGLF